MAGPDVLHTYLLIVDFLYVHIQEPSSSQALKRNWEEIVMEWSKWSEGIYRENRGKYRDETVKPTIPTRFDHPRLDSTCTDSKSIDTDVYLSSNGNFRKRREKSEPSL